MFDADALFKRLPEVYQEADGDDGPLRALLSVLAEGAETLKVNIDDLYDDLFIETAADDLISYIGELIGVTPLRNLGDSSASRAWVANTISYRRRKGTALGLRQVAQDVFGYRAAVTETFRLLEWTQNLNHPSRRLPRTPSLRDTNALELLGGPLESAARTVEIRNVASERGRYGISNILIHGFTTHAFPIRNTRPRKGPDSRSFLFDPWGRDIPLFNLPEPEPSRTEKPYGETSGPVAMRRRLLRDELEKVRAAAARGDVYVSPLFDAEPIFQIRDLTTGNFIPPAEMACVNLEMWGNGPTALTYTDANGAPKNLPIRVCVDPVNGRFRFTAGQTPIAGVSVSYTYGAPSTIGGGPYDRTAGVEKLRPGGLDFYRIVTKQNLGAQPHVVSTVAQAIADWNLLAPNKDGLIVIVDSETYDEGVMKVTIPAGSDLVVLAASWPAPTVATKDRDPQVLDAKGIRPVINGQFSIFGSAKDGADSPGQFGISGLWINGSVIVSQGNLGRLEIQDCTLLPGASPINIQSGAGKRLNRMLEAFVTRTVCGDISVTPAITGLTISECAIKGTVKAETTPVTFDRTTITRPVSVQSVEASETIFTDTLTCQRTQIGCVRFSYFPPGSKTPRAYRCQPETAVKENPTEDSDQVRSRISPSFVSVSPSHPSFLRLAASTPVEIRAGAEDEDGMGVYHREFLTLRKANLRFALSEHLRIGLSAGIFDAN